MKISSRISLTYIFAWILISVFHALLLIVVYNIPFTWSVVDSLVSNGLLFVIGVGFLLMLHYEDRHVSSKLRSVFQLVFSYLVALSLFFVVNDSLLLYFSESDATYRAFFLIARIPRVILAAMLLLLMLIFFRFYLNLLALREKTEQSLKLGTMLRESELTALRWQINPHFLFNSLNSISSLTISNPMQAQEMFIKLSDLLRYSLRRTEIQSSTLAMEIQHIRLYTDIELVRFGDRLHVEIEAPKECLQLEMPFLIMQPVIENAVKHGIYSTEKSGTILVVCSCDPNYLIVSVENTFDPEGRMRSGTGTGLRNISERMKLMYNNDSLIRISEENNVFRVVLKFPRK